jgi:hypothetical protein
VSVEKLEFFPGGYARKWLVCVEKWGRRGQRVEIHRCEARSAVLTRALGFAIIGRVLPRGANLALLAAVRVVERKGFQTKKKWKEDRRKDSKPPPGRALRGCVVEAETH